MDLAFIAGALLSAATPPVSAPADQTSDASLLLRFLDLLEAGRSDDAQALLAPGAFVGDYVQARRTPFAQFAAYARDCKLDHVKLVSASDQRMPIGVQWTCRYPEVDRNASFWFEGKRISRIGWGSRPTVEVPALPQR
jgi:hypothetical protein